MIKFIIDFIYTVFSATFHAVSAVIVLSAAAVVAVMTVVFGYMVIDKQFRRTLSKSIIDIVQNW